MSNFANFFMAKGTNHSNTKTPAWRKCYLCESNNNFCLGGITLTEPLLSPETEDVKLC